MPCKMLRVLNFVVYLELRMLNSLNLFDTHDLGEVHAVELPIVCRAVRSNEPELFCQICVVCFKYLKSVTSCSSNVVVQLIVESTQL
jgi:hypothetical protein